MNVANKPGGMHMISAWWLALAFFVGVFVGGLLMALCAAGGKNR